uniref:Predicted protein n=1 Tax=Hordeum vulgare subsp. vulgare TaxID=112509 RepID=F2E8E6_HORVV|nr:predicted protein [Hordeum vulgare subsp. vulgare]
MRMRNPTAALSAAAMLLLLLVSPAAAATWTVSGREIWYRERSDVEARLVFGAWKAKFGKTYSSVGEEERRYAVFKETLRLVDQHNAAGEAGVPVARMGINGLADMTTEEWNVICCGAGRSGPPSTGGRKERSGRSRPWSSRGIHYFMHLYGAYQAAVSSILHWCAGEWGGESHKGVRRAGEASLRGRAAVSRGSTVAALEPE